MALKVPDPGDSMLSKAEPQSCPQELTVCQGSSCPERRVQTQNRPHRLQFRPHLCHPPFRDSAWPSVKWECKLTHQVSWVHPKMLFYEVFWKSKNNTPFLILTCEKWFNFLFKFWTQHSGVWSPGQGEQRPRWKQVINNVLVLMLGGQSLGFIIYRLKILMKTHWASHEHLA